MFLLLGYKIEMLPDLLSQFCFLVVQTEEVGGVGRTFELVP
jgi:hypothetical protein